MLTKKQLELLKYIEKRILSDGVSPSFEEMKGELNLKSKSGIHRLITALEERGFIKRLANKARALEVIKVPNFRTDEDIRSSPSNIERRINTSNVIDFSPRSLEVPVMGKIAAGTPIEAINDYSHNISIPQDMVNNKNNHYALEITGDSMIEAGINDGDIVIIKEQKTANNGDIVVALIEETEATLKRFRRHGRSIALEPANPSYKTRVIPDDQIDIQGRLVGLIRSY